MQFIILYFLLTLLIIFISKNFPINLPFSLLLFIITFILFLFYLLNKLFNINNFYKKFIFLLLISSFFIRSFYFFSNNLIIPNYSQKTYFLNQKQISNPKGLTKYILNYINYTLNKINNIHAKGLAFSLITGNKKSLNFDKKDLFRITGIAHLLAISGLHASILLNCFYFLFRKLQLSRNTSYLIIITLILTLYLLITNFSIPLLRTYLMTTFNFLFIFLDRKINLLLACIYSALIILFISPMNLFSISFQLTFTAILGIILGIKSNQFLKIKSPIIQFFFIFINCQFLLNPIIVYYFNYNNFLGIFHTSLILPFIFLILILAIFMLLLPIEFAQYFLANLIEYSSFFLFNILEWLSLYESPYFYGTKSMVVFSIFYCFLMLISYLIQRTKKKKHINETINYNYII